MDHPAGACAASTLGRQEEPGKSSEQKERALMAAENPFMIRFKVFNEFHEEVGDRHFTLDHSALRQTIGTPSESIEKTPLTAAIYTIETYGA